VAEGPVRGWVHEQVLPEGRWRVAPALLVDDLARHTASSPAPRGHDTLVLLPRRQLRTLNSQLRDTAAPGGRHDEPTVFLHPDDAARAGVTDGDRVLVTSAFGSTRGAARHDPGMRPGTVAVPHGFDGTRVGSLVTGSTGFDPVTGMVRQSGVSVTVTREP
jgi:anaerobic selenocysteine-containing dehydrogenase